MISLTEKTADEMAIVMRKLCDSVKIAIDGEEEKFKDLLKDEKEFLEKANAIGREIPESIKALKRSAELIHEERIADFKKDFDMFAHFAEVLVTGE